jgi:1,4-alpha-glucan branching enzyme
MCDNIRPFAGDRIFRAKINPSEVKTMKIKATKKCNCEDKKVVTKKVAEPKKGAAKKTCAKKETMKSVTFTIHAEKGKDVFVAGEFNDWNPTAKKMAYKSREGIYTATIKLAIGTYQYKFVIDGVWCADPENVESVANDQGTFNSIITVK